MKKALISTLVAMLFIIGGCVSIPVDYSKPETHSQIANTKVWPMMAYPVEVQVVIDELEAKNIKLVGCVVSNDGSFVLLFDHPEHGVLGLVCDNRGRPIRTITEKDAWTIFEALCVKNNRCTDNPHLDGTASAEEEGNKA